MAYDEDITVESESNPISVTENGCFITTILVTILLIIIGLTTLYDYLSNPIPAILTLGLTALILSILYLATVIKNTASMK